MKDLLCALGFHNWKTEYFGAGYPMREWLWCGLTQVKPMGYQYWLKAGIGVTLETTKKLHEMHDRMNRGDFSEFTTKDEEVK